VARVEQRILEASRMGFEKIIVSGYHRNIKDQTGIKVLPVYKIEGLVKLLFA
jgi:DNA repair protein RadA/Sms